MAGVRAYENILNSLQAQKIWILLLVISSCAAGAGAQGITASFPNAPETVISGSTFEMDVDADVPTIPYVAYLFLVQTAPQAVDVTCNPVGGSLFSANQSRTVAFQCYTGIVAQPTAFNLGVSCAVLVSGDLSSGSALPGGCSLSRAGPNVVLPGPTITLTPPAFSFAVDKTVVGGQPLNATLTLDPAVAAGPLAALQTNPQGVVEISMISSCQYYYWLPCRVRAYPGTTTFTIPTAQVGADTRVTLSATITAYGGQPLTATAATTVLGQSTYIQAQLISPQLNPTAPLATTDPRSKTAHVPLGSTFKLSLLQKNADGSFTPIPCSFTLAPVSKTRPSALFPDSAVFAFKPDSTQPGTATFQAVHLGGQTLQINPDDNSIQPVTMTITVEGPSTLGSDHNDLDNGIISIADVTGVPPQMIKGQAFAEGRFNPYTFRYEPLYDDALIISRGQDLRVEDPYQDFRIPTIGDDWDPGDCQVYPDVNLAIPDTSCPGLDLGITFDQYEMESITGSNQDFHLRTWLRDPNTGQVVTDSNEIPISRLLGAEDRYISAQDVYTASNGLFHWDRAAGRYAPQRIALLSFTGEFPLAGSYGLLQMKYFTAISKLHWGGVSPPCAPATAPLDPTGLYDTPCNLENGGGSLQLGTQMVMKEFARHFSPMPSIDGVGTFETDFTQAYQEYDPGQPGYGTNVIRLSNSYLPVAATTIFALGVQQ